MSISPGTKLGPYQIEAELGAGGMGEVYRARDPRLGREVAIKLLPVSSSSDPARVHRFEQEARAAAGLGHPNILEVYDVGTQNGTPFIVSELLQGETLRDRLRMGAIPLRKAVDYATQMARGLAAAHDRGIVHRDLKPANIFLTRDGRVKILDFGLAKLTRPDLDSDASLSQTLAADSEPGTVLGTVGYMSPEQVRGKPADGRSDIFSFGAILYEMISGRRAFRGDSAAETMSAILKEDPPDLTETNRSLPPGLERVVRHCLEKNAEERFQSAHDIAFDLESLSAASSGALPVAVPIPRRNFRIAAAGLALVALILLVLAFLVGRTTTAAPPPPQYTQVTFRRGYVSSARFAANGNTVVYAASWEGTPTELFSTNAAGRGSLPLNLGEAEISAVSSSGEMLIVMKPNVILGWCRVGTLARVPIAGGGARALLEGVQSADWAGDGSIAVSRYSQQRYRLEYPVGKVLFETDGWISHVRISPTGDAVAFIHHPLLGDDRGDIVMVDRSGKMTSLAAGWSAAQGLAWTPAGNEVWFTASDSGINAALYAVTPSGRRRAISRVPGRMELHDISPDGRILMVHHTVTRGLAVLGAGQSKERDLSFMDWTRSDDLSRDGQYILFEEQGEGGGPNYSVYLRKTDGSPPVRLGEGSSQSLSPDGKWVLTVSLTTPGQISLLPTGAGEARQITNDKLSHASVAWFPDGKHILFTGQEPGHSLRSYISDTEGSKPRPITPEGVHHVSPQALSPDGRLLLAKDAQQHWFIYPVAGGDPRPLPAIETREWPVGWAEDGRSVFVSQLQTLPAQVFRVDTLTGKRSRFKQFMPADAAGSRGIDPIHITPDGKHYAYGFIRALSNVYVVDRLK